MALRAVGVLLGRFQLLHVEHGLLDQCPRDPVPPPGALAVVAGGVVLGQQVVDVLDPGERQRRRLEVAEPPMFDVEQRFLERLVAGNEGLPRAVALAQHAEPAE